MLKRFILLGIVLLSFVVKAHQADVSTTMLVENENGTWVLQISSSLTAFQQEIKMHFSDTPYKTPEEFQTMVLQHIKNNFHVIVNGEEELTLSNGVVRLGHETKVVFEVFGMPKELKTVIVKNSAFEDIHKNQSALLLLKEGFNKKRFVLNNTNEHTIALAVDGNRFVKASENQANLFSNGMILIVIGAVAAIALALKSRVSKKNRSL